MQHPKRAHEIVRTHEHWSRSAGALSSPAILFVQGGIAYILEQEYGIALPKAEVGGSKDYTLVDLWVPIFAGNRPTPGWKLRGQYLFSAGSWEQLVPCRVQDCQAEFAQASAGCFAFLS